MWADLARLIPEHGYWLTLLGALLEGETLLVLAGLASSRGYLALPELVALGALGGFVGDQIYFAVGRRAGARVLARYPRAAAHAGRATSLIERFPELSVVLIRFLYGLRIVGPIAIGMTRIGWLHYAALNALGALAWSAAWLGLGYVAGTAVEALLGDLKHVEHLLFAVALGVLAIASIVLHRRRRRGPGPRRAKASAPPR